MALRNLLLLFMVMLALGCQRNKTYIESDIKKKPAKFLVSQLKNQQLDYEWFHSKAKLKITEKGKTQSATSVIRMRKDSVIWFTLNKVGFEGARVKITPDSIHILLRREKEYYVRDFSFLSNDFSLTASFDDLQQMMLGNAVFRDVRKWKSSIESPYHKLSESKGGIEQDILIQEPGFLLAGMLFNEPEYKRSVHLQLGKYKTVEESINFAHER
ncbi:MAG: DUF4292 domain-containing protein, partial [Bacteroidota bacterium]